jgi:hypothetical protein
LDDRISVKNLRKHFDEIKQITDASLSKSDRKKIRQTLVIRLVNELYGFDEEVLDHAQLESLLKNSSGLREFVKGIRGAITGMTTMMGDYVDKGISFDSWQKITEGRDTLKAHYKTKAEKIKKAAKVLRDVQAEALELDESVIKTLPMEAKIDLLSSNSLPEELKFQLSKLASDDVKHAEASKKMVASLRASEITKYQNDPSGYELPKAF